MPDVEIRPNPELWRFEAHLEGRMVGVLRWRDQGERLAFISTNVEPAYEGRGIGGQLVQAGLEWARSEGRQVVPVCSFVQSYIERNPDYRDVVTV